MRPSLIGSHQIMDTLAVTIEKSRREAVCQCPWPLVARLRRQADQIL